MTNKQLKNSLSILTLLFSMCFLNAQTLKDIEIIGVVLDKNTKQPIESATILIADNKTLNPIHGSTTNSNGSFSLTTNATNFYIEVSFIGYKKSIFNKPKNTTKLIDLKTIYLEEDLESLSEVTIIAEKSTTEFRLDKRIFNVGSDLASSGSSALEVLNNVPSVNVDIEGQISLRGSQGVQILINGKPSVLASGDGNNALGTITAEMIEKIEVVTNPSAKYDAEGTSGILNIILKKDQKKGINGSVSVNIGDPSSQSFGLSINRRTENLNIFSQLGLGKRTFPRYTDGTNYNVINDELITNNSYNEMREKFYNFLLGSDFFLNENNVITLSVNYAYEKEDTPGTNNYSRFDENNNLTDQWQRTEFTLADNPKWGYELQYKKDFDNHEDHDLLFSAIGSSFSKDSESDFEDIVSLGSYTENGQEKNLTDYGRLEYTFKLDYTRPFSEKYTLETGAQYYIQDVFNDYEVQNFVTNSWVSDPNLTNVFEYNQNVLGLYATTSYEDEKWGLKLGARLENTDLKTLLETTNEKRNQNYSNLFPSVHTSYKISETLSLQAGYSKRINRPGLRELNPFSVRRDNFNISQGNPDLDPEFTDSYEITSIMKIGDVSLNLGVYHRYTTDVIEETITYMDDISTRMPLNIGTNNVSGIEFNGKYSPANWATFSADANFNFFKRKGEFEGTSFNFTGDLWSSKLNSQFKLPAGIEFEITGNYRSPYKGVIENRGEEIYADAGIRKKVFKGKVIINLSAQDVFASRKFISSTTQSNYILNRNSTRGRFITLGVSYGFGKGEAMEFSGQRRRF
ncbi:TonB-dependent receptor [Pseudalgibacter alginicilyticus]|uniref:TonB-dependent receptor n=2 Tax=Pseudalgibacter alginicilyticus TaxID=1736674 RepID=A0A0N7HYG6_9FLAO|nr:TonB-dependent receptor [Pseudalgibacter alginicilyticus]